MLFRATIFDPAGFDKALVIVVGAPLPGNIAQKWKMI